MTEGRVERTIKGPFLPGELHHMSRFSNEEVKEMRKRYEGGGVTQRQLALESGVSQRAICKIVTKQSYRNV